MEIFLFILIGFVAQLVDGALGMAYGVTSTTFLLSFGVSPAVASATVHTAEMITSGISGFSHWRLGNVSKKLFFKLLVPGVLGGITGAYILTSIPGDVIKPFIAIYLLAMGLLILWKAFRKVEGEGKVTNGLIPLGLIGGFFDAIGGGGWGPIVTSTLVATGHKPRWSIGSVNLAEFFITTAQAVTFFLAIGLQSWVPIVGLMIGGAFAAPLAAYVCKKLSARALMFMVGALIIVLSIRTIILVLV